MKLIGDRSQKDYLYLSRMYMMMLIVRMRNIITYYNNDIEMEWRQVVSVLVTVVCVHTVAWA